MKAGVDISGISVRTRGENCMDQMSVHYKALVFQLIYLITYYMQGDGCFGPTKGRTFQTGIISSSYSVGG